VTATSVGPDTTETTAVRATVALLEEVIEGGSDPQQFIPYLLQLHGKGKFPFDRLVKTFPFAEINEAIAAANAGAVIKPVLVFE
jgi:Zn-dependent alcohol dehydrogenase